MKSKRDLLLFMFDVQDLDIDKQIRCFIAAENLDQAFELLAENFGNGREGYDFFGVQKLGLVRIPE